MKAITLFQPHATLVALKLKPFETRGWGTEYRGELAIHAAARIPRECRALMELPAFRFALRNVPRPLPLGVIVCKVDLQHIFDAEELIDQPELPGLDGGDITRLGHLHFGDFSKGRKVWQLGNVVTPAKPIPARGGQRFWNWKGLWL